MHRGLTVSVPLLRMWVHCPRASNGLLPRRSNLVGYVRWDAQSDRFPPCQTIISTALQVAILFAHHSGTFPRVSANRVRTNVNSTRSCLCVHSKGRCKKRLCCSLELLFVFGFLPSARLPGKIFRQRGLIDNRLVLELEA